MKAFLEMNDIPYTKISTMRTEDEETKILITVDQRSKSNGHRLDKVEQDIDALQKSQNAIYQLAASVQVIAQQTKTTSDNVEVLSNKIDQQTKTTSRDVQALSDKIDRQDRARISAEQELESKILRTQTADAIKTSANVDKIKVAVITAICSGAATLILGKIFGM